MNKNFQEWRDETLQARLLATGETDTSDLTLEKFIKSIKAY